MVNLSKTVLASGNRDCGTTVMAAAVVLVADSGDGHDVHDPGIMRPDIGNGTGSAAT